MLQRDCEFLTVPLLHGTCTQWLDANLQLRCGLMGPTRCSSWSASLVATHPLPLARRYGKKTRGRRTSAHHTLHVQPVWKCGTAVWRGGHDRPLQRELHPLCKCGTAGDDAMGGKRHELKERLQV